MPRAELRSMYRRAPAAVHPDKARSDVERERRSAAMATLNLARDDGRLEELLAYAAPPGAGAGPHPDWHRLLEQDDPLTWPGGRHARDDSERWLRRLATVHAAFLVRGRTVWP